MLRFTLLFLAACALALGQTLSAPAGPASPVTVTTLGALRSFTYTSGATASCSSGQYLLFTFADGSTAHVACAAGGNTITAATAGTSIVAGTGFATPPTTAACSTGTAGTTCSGTIVLASITAATAVPGLNVNATSGALSYVLPTAFAGAQLCFRNGTGKSAAVTLRLPASTYLDINGVNGSAAGTLVSGGALGDAVCLLGVTTTEYFGQSSSGAWTNN